MRKALFIDRDGTLIEEPKDEQVDSIDKLVFKPGVFTALGRIARLSDYELVMVTNQDGLGTPSFPEETFWPIQNLLIRSFESEGVKFSRVLIDRTFPSDNAPTRKPGTGMLKSYLDGSYDLSNSYVIGDRESDAELARRMGCKSLTVDDNMTWERIATIVVAGERTASMTRSTAETSVSISLNLDGTGQCNVSTGIGFFDHMLAQIARHGNVDLTVKTIGDLNVDEHHTVEDTAIVLGECLRKALGDKRGIERYGFCLPMDDCLCTVALDFSGRPYLQWNADFHRERIGDMPTELFSHFFKSLSDCAMMNLSITAEGENEHHKIEGIFKAFARSLKLAVNRDLCHFYLPSSKGVL